MWSWTPVPEWLLTGFCCKPLTPRSTGTLPVAQTGRRLQSIGTGWSLTCCKPSPSLTAMKTSPPSSKERSVNDVTSCRASLQRRSGCSRERSLRRTVGSFGRQS
ncbi:hypothetical protein PAMP_023251 [Pampus punctatissimus]